MPGSQLKEKMFKCLGQGHKNILSADRWPHLWSLNNNRDSEIWSVLKDSLTETVFWTFSFNSKTLRGGNENTKAGQVNVDL